MMKIVLASRNRGKITEMTSLLGALPVELISAGELPGAPDVSEDEETLEGNARKKAESLHRFTGLPSLADDTGLEVDALGGKPGVHSARFAGSQADDRANRMLLLELLAGEQNRFARFRTVVVFIDDLGLHYFEGICQGEIATGEQGTGGFGYDALFLPEGENRTFAEMDDDEKNAISHRGRALGELTSYLRERLGGR
ncbi:MAG: RdgB/HAM1 family non-canonical purine NTP pyrophosphatase [Rhodothermales bacterium]